MRGWCGFVFWVMSAAFAFAAPFDVAPLFDTAKPDLGLVAAPGTQNITVYHPDGRGDAFSNGVVLMPFKGRLYAQWQSSARNEDSADTRVVFSSSADGKVWRAPQPLTGRAQKVGMHTSGGWWSDGKTLIAYINLWPEGFRTAEDRHPGGLAYYSESRDGVHWSALKPVTGADGRPVNGIIEQDPHKLASGRLVTAFHLRPGMIAAPFYTDDPRGVTGWQRGAMANLPHDGDVSRELEPSLFVRADGALVMVFRDEGGSFRVLASQSLDGGASWSVPVLTNMPDARAKLSAGNLPEGTAFVVNAPSGNKVRVPLALSLSSDGQTFTRSWLLRGAPLPPVRISGTYKRPGYHYPKSVVWQGYLYVGYSVGKEDVALTRVPLASLGMK